MQPLNPSSSTIASVIVFPLPWWKRCWNQGELRTLQDEGGRLTSRRVFSAWCAVTIPAPPPSTSGGSGVPSLSSSGEAMARRRQRRLCAQGLREWYRWPGGCCYPLHWVGGIPACRSQLAGDITSGDAASCRGGATSGFSHLERRGQGAGLSASVSGFGPSMMTSR